MDTNITNIADLGYTLINITSGDLGHLTQEKEIVEREEEEEVVGYEVRLKVGDLEQKEECMFAVAAGSAIGLGDFSQVSTTLMANGPMASQWCLGSFWCGMPLAQTQLHLPTLLLPPVGQVQ